jgi:hypothetical protein
LASPVGSIVFDIYPKAIALGDEDKAKDQGKAIRHLSLIKERYPLHVALVGHTGKDERRGAREGQQQGASLIRDSPRFVSFIFGPTAGFKKAGDEDPKHLPEDSICLCLFRSGRCPPVAR